MHHRKTVQGTSTTAVDTKDCTDKKTGIEVPFSLPEHNDNSNQRECDADLGPWFIVTTEIDHLKWPAGA